MRRGVPSVAMALLAMAGTARGQRPPSVRLEYERGPGANHCPDEDGLRGAVAMRLGYDPFRPDGADRVTVHVERLPRQLRARVALRDHEGRTTGAREFLAPATNCAELTAVVALAVSVAIDPLGVGRGPQPGSAPSPRATPEDASETTTASPPRAPSAPLPPAPPVVPPARSGPQPTRAEPTRVGLSAGAVASVGAAPSIAVGFTLGAAVRWRWLSAGGELRLDLPSSRDVAGGGGVESSLAMAALVPCVHVHVVALCGLGAVGELSYAGLAISTPQEGSTPFLGLGGRLAFELPVGRIVALRFHLDVLATLLGTQVTFETPAPIEVWRTSRTSVALGIAAVGRLK